MEIAHKIQTALLPKKNKIGNYEIASLMVPAKMVGGDYFDVMETSTGKLWLGIGDVSGHGVESGLIMMMAQTSIATAISLSKDNKPSAILDNVNSIIKENISRLNVDRYMTLSLLYLEDTHIVTAGRHQDIYIHRSSTHQIEQISIRGTWIGILDDISMSNPDVLIPVGENDVIFLFTDGLSEAFNQKREMFGIENLVKLFREFAELPVDQIVTKIYNVINEYQFQQLDDITIVILKNTHNLFSSKNKTKAKPAWGKNSWNPI
jgi:serine phosphatase RsbU (regulator of sigma subunit)